MRIGARMEWQKWGLCVSNLLLNPSQAYSMEGDLGCSEGKRYFEGKFIWFQGGNIFIWGEIYLVSKGKSFQMCSEGKRYFEEKFIWFQRGKGILRGDLFCFKYIQPLSDSVALVIVTDWTTAYKFSKCIFTKCICQSAYASPKFCKFQIDQVHLWTDFQSCL